MNDRFSSARYQVGLLHPPSTPFDFTHSIDACLADHKRLHKRLKVLAVKHAATQMAKLVAFRSDVTATAKATDRSTYYHVLSPYSLLLSQPRHFDYTLTLRYYRAHEVTIARVVAADDTRCALYHRALTHTTATRFVDCSHFLTTTDPNAYQKSVIKATATLDRNPAYRSYCDQHLITKEDYRPVFFDPDILIKHLPIDYDRRYAVAQYLGLPGVDLNGSNRHMTVDQQHALIALLNSVVLVDPMTLFKHDTTQ